MQQDAKHPIVLYECTLGKAEYTDSNGKPNEIVLLDAIGPLLDLIPSGSKLLLESKPIAKAWPLITDAEILAEASKGLSKKRRRVKGDECETYLDDLMESLGRDIPQAIASLQEKKISSWLTVETQTDDDTYVACSDLHKRHEVSWPALEELRKESNTGDSIISPLEIKVADTVVRQSDEVIHRLVFNHTGQSLNQVRCKIDQDSSTEVKFHLPQRSAFLLTNLLRTQLEPPRGWSQLIDFAKEHPPALLLLDPPYPNLSAKRLQTKGSKYKPVDDLYDLWNMANPVKQILQIPTIKGGERQDVLIGCWVTNHAKAQRFILTKLFPVWKVQHVGQLVWIKVTTGGEKDLLGGELVFPLDNKQGRKPYEILLLGTRSKGKSLHPQTTQLVHPFTTLFASVPLDHSRKPDVFHLLSQHLDQKKEPNVYELFARSLHSGPAQSGGKGYWVSIGNEPFKFNQEAVGYLTPGGKETSSTDV